MCTTTLHATVRIYLSNLLSRSHDRYLKSGAGLCNPSSALSMRYQENKHRVSSPLRCIAINLHYKSANYRTQVAKIRWVIHTYVRTFWKNKFTLIVVAVAKCTERNIPGVSWLKNHFAPPSSSLNHPNWAIYSNSCLKGVICASCVRWFSIYLYPLVVLFLVSDLWPYGITATLP